MPYVMGIIPNHRIKIQPKIDGTMMKARVLIKDRQNMLVYTATIYIPLQPLITDIQRIISSRSDMVGFSLSIPKLIKKISLKNIVNRIKSVASEPVFQTVLKGMSTVYPPLGVTLATVQRVSTAIDDLKAGDPQAREMLSELNARREEPQARKLLDVFKSVALAKAEGQDINEWVLNKAKQAAPSSITSILRGNAKS